MSLRPQPFVFFNTMSDCDIDELMPEAGAAPPALDRHDKELGTQECWCAVPIEEDEVKEVKQDVVEKEVGQETQKGTDRMESEDEETEEFVVEEASADHIRWAAVQRGKDGMDGIALGVDGELAKQLSAAYRHRFTMSDLEGLSVGDDVLRYFNSGLYDTKIVKRYRLVYIPQRQGEMWEVHYSFWHASGVCQFIPCGWNDLCECYHQENPTFVMTYD